MKKKILFGILFSAILAINVISVSKTDLSDLSLISLIQTAQAQAESGECYPWSPNYNIVTGKCDSNVPYGEVSVQGESCVTWDGSNWVPTGTYATNCEPASPGPFYCTPIDC